MDYLDFTDLSPRNAEHSKWQVTVANGATFIALNLSESEKFKASNILYLHVHKQSRRCYVGITVQEAGKRWIKKGSSYRLNRRFGRALKKYGWRAFDSHVIAFADDREALNEAEVKAIAAAGGHKSKYTYNLSPGGDLVAENDKPITGVYLPTGELRDFKSGSDAARALGLKSTDNPMQVVRGELLSANDWWFRLADDTTSQPPELWGEKLRHNRLRELKARPVVAINFKTREERNFETMNDAATALGIHQSEVSAVANGKAHSAGGWWIKFEDDNRDMPEAWGSNATRSKRDKKIFAHHLQTGERREFRNCTVADNELGIHQGAAGRVARGERVSAADWWFTYDSNGKPPKKFKGALVSKARSKPVIATELATGCEHHFESVKLAAGSLGMSRSIISRVIAGKAKSAKGYSFRSS